jgi:hypothetical protein
MARLEVAPFADEHLEDAARLLAARHARQREAEPLLSERFEEPATAREELVAAWSAEGASGAVAFREGRLVGYLAGSPREVEVWGENVWIGAAGHAAEEGYRAMVTDWRVTNLLASRFWPRRGFRTAFRLYRSIP